MSIDPKKTPTYEISSAEDRSKILSEVLAHAAQQEAQYRTPIADPYVPGRWKTPVALLVFMVAGLVALFPPRALAGDEPSLPTVSDQVRGLTAALRIEAQRLEAYRVREGRLPGSLDEVGVEVSGIRYVRSNNRVYQLVATGPDGQNVVYDSTQPGKAFDEVAAGWLEEPSGG